MGDRQDSGWQDNAGGSGWSGAQASRLQPNFQHQPSLSPRISPLSPLARPQEFHSRCCLTQEILQSWANKRPCRTQLANERARPADRKGMYDNVWCGAKYWHWCSTLVLPTLLQAAIFCKLCILKVQKPLIIPGLTPKTDRALSPWLWCQTLCLAASGSIQVSAYI